MLTEHTSKLNVVIVTSVVTHNIYFVIILFTITVKYMNGSNLFLNYFYMKVNGEIIVT